MKKTLMLLLFIGLFTACNKTPTTVDEPAELTTVEQHSRLEKDTVLYKVLEVKNHTYIVDPKTNLIIKDCVNHSGACDTLGLITAIVIVIMIIGIIIISD